VIAHLRLMEVEQSQAASQRALARALALELGDSTEQVRIVREAGGKPRTVDGNVSFSWSTSGGYALLAVARGCELGVDLEVVRARPAVTQLAGMGPVERALLRRCSDRCGPRCFLRLWTAKEAAVKTTGDGLRALRDTAVAWHWDDESDHWIVTGVTVRDVHLVAHELVPAPQFVGTLCSTAMAIEPAWTVR